MKTGDESGKGRRTSRHNSDESAVQLRVEPSNDGMQISSTDVAGTRDVVDGRLEVGPMGR